MRTLAQKILAAIQKLAVADKTAIAGAVVGAATVLATRFGWNLNASDTAYLDVAVILLIGAFTHYHFATKK